VEERWYRLERLDLPRGLIILDVSRVAERLWPVFFSLLEGLTESLPATSWPDICFLGDTTRYPLRQFLDAAESLHSANSGRGRVIGPLFHRLEVSPPTSIVLIGCGPIVDLEDWYEMPLLQRTKFAKLTPQLSLTNGKFPETMVGVDELAQWLNLSLSSITIDIPSGGAFDWDVPVFSWKSGQLRSESPDGVPVRIGVLQRGDESAIARLELRDGSQLIQPLERCDPPSPAPWRNFTATEFTVLDQWRRTGGYECKCGQRHPAGEWCCATAGEVRPLLPSFSAIPSGRCVKIRIGAFNAKYQVGSSFATRAPSDQIAVADEQGRFAIFRFDAVEWKWVPTGTPTLWLTLEENLYAMVV